MSMAEELNPEGAEGMSFEGGVSQNQDRQSVESQEVRAERAPEKGAEAAREKYAEILSKVTSHVPTATSDDDLGIDAKSIYNETDEEARVTKLLSLAETKGVIYAVRVAQHLNDFYVLDRMHDELAGRFYDALKERGLIAE